MEKKLSLKNVSVFVDNKNILNNINIEIKPGEVVVLLGPNGAGKSTISNIIMGNSKYELVSGNIELDGENINDLETNERAKKGLYMSFQHPSEISGVTMMNFLRTSYNLIKGQNMNVSDFANLLKKKMEVLEMDKKFKSRSVNFGFSGGEKKRSEMLQLLLFEPKYAILDEIDSGLDIDALKLVCSAINKIKAETSTGFLIITHYNKIFDYTKPDKVYILKNGKIFQEGKVELIKEIQKKGFS